MKVKSVLLTEMRGSVSKPVFKDRQTFKTYRDKGIILEKKPEFKKGWSRKQRLHRHNYMIWRLIWAQMTDEEREAYREEADKKKITPYNEYLHQKMTIPQKRVFFEYTNDPFEFFPRRVYCNGQLVSVGIEPDWRIRTYLKPYWGIIPFDISISKAELWLKVYEARDGYYVGTEIYCYKVLEDWNCKSLNWDNQPTVSDTATDTAICPDNDQWFSFDVTADIQDLISNKKEPFGWQLRGPEEDPPTDVYYVDLYGQWHYRDRPYLLLYVED